MERIKGCGDGRQNPGQSIRNRESAFYPKCKKQVKCLRQGSDTGEMGEKGSGGTNRWLLQESQEREHWAVTSPIEMERNRKLRGYWEVGGQYLLAMLVEMKEAVWKHLP